MIEYSNVGSLEDAMIVEQLAREIFHEHYDEYMDPGHVAFYLDKYQTASVVYRQISENFDYYLIKSAGNICGYLGLERKKDVLHISKLYLLKAFRKGGLGDQALKFALQKAVDGKFDVVDLYVNERNLGGIRFYTTRGFVQAGEMKHHYENGHTEIDLLMKMKVLN